MCSFEKNVSRMLLLVFCAVVVLVVLSPYGAAQAPATGAKPPIRGGPTVLSDGQVKFVLNAPQATQVMLNLQDEVGPSPAAKPVPMTKDDTGVWSVTVGPLKPNFYGYGFLVNGAAVPDPANRNIWNQTNSAWSSVFVPGPEADYMADTSVPHGYVATVRYFSKLTKSERQMTVYTPPGYGQSKEAYPVLYLSHGGGGNDTDWIVCMRANYIMDNLIAQGKAKPMIIVMPDGNVNVPGQQVTSITQNVYPEELLNNVVPAAEQNFRIAPGSQNRALAGLSMGGGLTLATLFQKAGALSHYGIFSSGLSDALRDDLVKNHMDMVTTLAANKEIKLIWINCGTEDIAYKNNMATVEFFKKYGINHKYVEGAGTHIWDFWRHSLLNLAPLLFR